MYWGNTGVISGLYLGYITVILGLHGVVLGLCWDFIWILLGFWEGSGRWG